MPTPNWPQSWQGPARTCVDSRVGPSRPRLTSFFFSFMFTTNRLICRYSTRAQPAAAASNHPYPPLMFTAECGVESVLSMWCLHHLMFHHTGTGGLALAPCYLWQSLLIHCHIATTLPAGQGSVCVPGNVRPSAASWSPIYLLAVIYTSYLQSITFPATRTSFTVSVKK